MPHVAKKKKQMLVDHPKHLNTDIWVKQQWRFFNIAHSIYAYSNLVPCTSRPPLHMPRHTCNTVIIIIEFELHPTKNDAYGICELKWQLAI